MRGVEPEDVIREGEEEEEDDEEEVGGTGREEGLNRVVTKSRPICIYRSV
jgi:hypothetical protein